MEHESSVVDPMSATLLVDGSAAIRGTSAAVQELLGCTGEELVGRSLTAFVHPDDLDVAVRCAAGGAGEQWMAVQFRLRGADGEWRIVEALTEPWSNEDTLRLIHLRDPQRFALAEQRARQVSQMIAVSRIAGQVAHEFNNLFTVMQGHVCLVEESSEVAQPLRSELRSVLGAIDHGTRLTRQLLAYTRQQVLRPETLELGAVVRGLEPELRRLIPTPVELVLAESSAPVYVEADRERLEHAILALVTNACDAMDDGGFISIAACEAELGREQARRYTYPVRPGRYGVLVVSDTGHGMDGSTVSQLFQPFYTTRDRSDRVGLGLPGVYGTVKQSGGYVWVDSAVGVGTAVSVYLPLMLPALEATAAPAAPASSLATILVVEDNPAVRALIVRSLLRAGHSVLEAHDGAEALRVASLAGAIDVLVSDVMLPHLNGEEVAARLRMERPDLRVIYISGFSRQNGLSHSRFEEPGAFLQKPFAPGQLLGMINQLLAGVPA
jgi:two-component system, cell cycle sensor histidine kinase and response regulator CckA